MVTLARWIQGIRLFCKTCKGEEQGVILIHNDEKTGLTCGIEIMCSKCSKTMESFKTGGNSG